MTNQKSKCYNELHQQDLLNNLNYYSKLRCNLSSARTIARPKSKILILILRLNIFYSGLDGAYLTHLIKCFPIIYLILPFLFPCIKVLSFSLKLALNKHYHDPFFRKTRKKIIVGNPPAGL